MCFISSVCRILAIILIIFCVNVDVYAYSVRHTISGRPINSVGRPSNYTGSGRTIFVQHTISGMPIRNVGKTNAMIEQQEQHFIPRQPMIENNPPRDKHIGRPRPPKTLANRCSGLTRYKDGIAYCGGKY